MTETFFTDANLAQAANTTTQTNANPSEAVVCIVGLGYVGVPLAVAFDEADFEVLGYDVDDSKTATLADGTDPTNEVGDDRVAATDISFTTDATVINQADYIIITVPTPVDDMQNPDLDYVESSGRTIGKHMEPGTTVVLESTVYPGATRKVLVPILEEASGFTVGEEFAIGYSPERVAPGVPDRGVKNVSKIVGARRDDVRDDLARLYDQVVDAEVHRVPDIETAEAAKTIENVQRDINIALINELAMACDHMDLDTHEVLEAAGTKWNFDNSYRPGLVGGHCVPIDPLYLVHRSEDDGFSPKLILQAREINEHVPSHTAQLALQALNETGRVLGDSRLLVLGLAYKPNVSDVETSEVSGVINKLRTYDVDVGGYDPHADPAEIKHHLDISAHETPTFDGYDGIIIATDHDAFTDYDFQNIAAQLNEDPVCVDVPGLLSDDDQTPFTYDRL